MRLAGYDWVPETKLKRSLQKSWQRGRAGRSQKTSAGYLTSSDPELVHLQPDSSNSSVSDRPAWTEEVSGVVIGYCIYEILP